VLNIRCLQATLPLMCPLLQFAADSEERYHNRAAVLHLTAPDYATPAVDSFEAVLPRPPVGAHTPESLPCWAWAC
jgi:hypothetical protein